MKQMTLFFSLVFSLSCFASSVSNYKKILNHAEVNHLDRNLTSKGYNLTKVIDKYAQSPVRPLCLCEHFELTYTQFIGQTSKTHLYSIETLGEGIDMSIKINKIK